MRKSIIRRGYAMSITYVMALIASTVCAQPDHRPAAIATADGVFIYLGREIPKQQYYDLEVRDARGRYRQVAVIRAPRNLAEMEERINAFTSHFKMLAALTSGEISRMWDYFSANATTDSVYAANLPVMHLAMGTGYLDLDVTEGTERQYRVRLRQPDGREAYVAESNVVRMPATPDIPEPTLREVDASDGEIRLEWFVPRQGQLASYNVYRSIFGRNEFAPAPAIRGFNTNEDEVSLIAIDTAVSTPGHYEYFVVPLDAFGNPGPSSDTVDAGTLDAQTPSFIERLTARGSGNDHEVIVSWKISAGRYLRAIEIFRSTSYDSGFARIAVVPPADTAFIDRVPVASENFYYRIALRGPGRQTISSAVVSALYQDTRLPLPPSEIATETIDGGVRIYWSYNEPFVKGFFVERAVASDPGYRVVSPLIVFDSTLLSFADTTSAVRSYDGAFYRIVAVSDSDVRSAPSQPVSGTPGVHVLPGVPPRPDVRWEDGTVRVDWEDLRETEPYLMGYVLWRKEGDGVFEVAYTSRDGSTKNYYTDSGVRPGITYSYAVQVLDISGEASALSDSTSITIAVTGPAPPSFVRLLSTIDGVHVSWGRVMASDLKALRLYRQEPGSDGELIAELDTDQLDYTDKSVQRGTLYSYYLTSVGAVEGEPGELATIRY